ncbi:MAG: hypothetical protein ACLQBB_05705 [Solirubrobacteraceae bacterium]
METRVGEVMQSYATLTSSLLERWSAYASEVAAKIDAPGYTAATAAEDLTACATLATEGGFLMMAEWLEAFTTLTGFEPDVSTEESQPFHAPAGASLALAGPLVKGQGLEEIPAAAVTIRPAQLTATETEFTLSVATAGVDGGTYYGTVEASTDSGVSPVAAWITVP